MKCFPQLHLQAWKKSEHLESGALFIPGFLVLSFIRRGCTDPPIPPITLQMSSGGEEGRGLAQGHTVMLQLTMATVMLRNKQLQNLCPVMRSTSFAHESAGWLI